MDIAKIRKKIKEEKEGREEKARVDATCNKEEAPEATPSSEEPDSRKAEEPAAPASQQPPIEDSGAKQGIENPPSPPIKAGRGKDADSGTAVKAAEPDEISEDINELLTFHLSTEEFAFRVSDIEEILRFQRITPVPRLTDYILGITSLRGKIIPVIDLKKRLSINHAIPPDQEKATEAGEGLAKRDPIDGTRKKILTLKGPKGPVGAVVDKVKGVIRISRSEIVDPPAHLTEAELVFIEGVVLYNGRFISVIRLEEILEINLK